MIHLATQDSKLFHRFIHLESETVKHSQTTQNNTQNKNETESLQSLATRVIERNKTVNKGEPENQNIVSSHILATKQYFNNESIQNYIDIHEKRSRIYQRESQLSKKDAEHEAVNDVIRLCAKNYSLGLGSRELNRFVNNFLKVIDYEC